MKLQALSCVGEPEPEGTIVIDMTKEPEMSGLHPPFDIVEKDHVYEAWIAEMDERLYPNCTVEEVGDGEVLVTRSDGVRFKGIGWLRKTVLLE